MRLSDIEWRSAGDHRELSARVQPDAAPGRDFRIYFRVPTFVELVPSPGDVFLCSYLLTSMFDREDLHIDAPVSERILADVDNIQSIFAKWYPGEMKRIRVTTAGTHAALDCGSGPRGFGSFFSGGVDSWHSLLAKREQITHLILVQGLDIRNSDGWLWQQTREAAEAAAVEYGKTLITVQTNIRQMTDKSDPLWGRRSRVNFWANVSHGSALAALAHGLSHVISSANIPSSHVESQLVPWGSHPFTDPLWSTEDLALVHEWDVGRMGKVARIAESTTALNSLRVCYQRVPNAYNCCQCEKCLRTMLALRACGALAKAVSFPLPLDLRSVAALDRPQRPSDHWYQEILDYAEHGDDCELRDAIRVLLGQQRSVFRIRARAGAKLARIGRKLVHRRIRRVVARLLHLEAKS